MGKPMRYRLYTDGSSHAKSGLPGGWAWLLVDPVTETVHAANLGSDDSTSNNRMELTAAIEGLAHCVGTLKAGDEVTLVSDSQYVLGTTSGGYSPSKNLDLVERLQGITKALLHMRVALTGEWVKGHSGEEWNETVDNMATKAKHELVEALERSEILRRPVTIIAGSRHITDVELVMKHLDEVPFKPVRTLCGMAPGVDLIGRDWAQAQAIPVLDFPKDERLGKKAGPFRNRSMAAQANSLILIWDGKSPGSADMLKVATKYGLLIHEVLV